MSWFSELFHGGKDPSKEANKYLDQIPGAVNPYYQPYINQGQDANKMLMEEYSKLLGNPNELYNQFASGYKQSPGYQTRLNEALQSASNAAAAGGMAGSPMHQQLAAQKAIDLSSKDFEDYLNHIMGLYGTGLSGEQELGEQGFKASTGYGDILGQKLGSQAQYGYAGQAGRNANQANMFNNLISGATTFAPGMSSMRSLNLLLNRSHA